MAYNEIDNSELRRLQMYELGLLKNFADICEKNDLRYYMIGGTMLGAIRHNGFIPWDDDVDIGMPREDYIRFLEIAETQLPDYIILLNYEKTPDYLRYFSRFVDTRVKIFNDSNSQTLVENAWIDIFPLDGTPKNKLVRYAWFAKLCFQRLQFHFSCFEELVNLNRPCRPKYQQAIIKFGETFKVGRRKNSKEILRKIERGLRKYPFYDADYVVNFFGAYVQKEIIPRKWFGKDQKYLFEDVMLSGAKEYDIYLRNFYGDYMVPPSDQHKDKHNISKIEYERG